jgi:hypothetical protein
MNNCQLIVSRLHSHGAAPGFYKIIQKTFLIPFAISNQHLTFALQIKKR